MEGRCGLQGWRVVLLSPYSTLCWSFFVRGHTKYFLPNRDNHPYRLYHTCNSLYLVWLYPNSMFHVTTHTDPRLGEGPLCTDCVSRLASTLQQVPLDVLSRGYFPQVILRPSPPDYSASPGEGFYIYAPSVLILPTHFRNDWVTVTTEFVERTAFNPWKWNCSRRHYYLSDLRLQNISHVYVLQIIEVVISYVIFI